MYNESRKIKPKVRHSQLDEYKDESRELIKDAFVSIIADYFFILLMNKEEKLKLIAHCLISLNTLI